MRLRTGVRFPRPLSRATALLGTLLFAFVPLHQTQAEPIVISKVGYQGLLRDAAGSPLNGTVSLTFRIFDLPAGGSLLWQETRPATPVANGLVTLSLGEVDPLPVDALVGPTDSGEVMRYLEVQVESDPPLSPRTLLLAAPYAVSAHRLAGDIQTMPGDIRLFGGGPPDDSMPVIHLGKDIGGGQRGIIIVNSTPADGSSSSAQLGTGLGGGEEAGIIIVNSTPADGSTSSAQMGTGLRGGEEVGIIVVDTRSGERVMTARFGAGLNGGDEAGIIIVNSRPAAAGGTDSARFTVSTDPLTGSSMQVDLQQASGIVPCVRVASDPVTGSTLRLDGDVAGGINPCVIVGADPAVGSSLELDFNQTSGIIPCVRVASDAIGASLTMSRTFAAGPTAVDGTATAKNPSGPGDSVSIEMHVDADLARMQLYAGNAASATPIVLTADGAEARIGINTNAPTVALDVVGDICVSGSVGACSDLRYKRDIQTIDGALDKVAALRGVEFDWRRDEFEAMHFAEGRQIGVIAQDVEAVLPELVNTRNDHYKTVDYTKLTAVLIEAVKELKSENAELRARLDCLETSTVAAVTR